MVYQSYKIVSINTSNPSRSPSVCNLENFDVIGNILDTARNIQDEAIVCKLSATILNNDLLLDSFINNIKLLSLTGAKVLIIHDISEIIESSIDLFGIKIPKDGVYDYKSSQILEMIVSGYINKKIVSLMCNNNINAIGISCKDCNLIRAQKFAKPSKNQKILNIKFDALPIMVNPEALASLFDSNMVVVCSPIASTTDNTTCILNTNLTASLLASTLGAKYLIFPNNTSHKELNKIFSNENKEILESHINSNNTITNIDLYGAALNAIENYVENVSIIDESDPKALINSIFSINKCV